MSLDKTMTRMAVGSLLHDVGKITQRSRWELSAGTRGLERLLCPTGPAGRYTHAHVLYTNEFFERLSDGTWPGLEPSAIANLASYHHSPSTPEQVIVQQADWLSAGQDRRDREEEDRPGYLKVPLRSIFARLKLTTEPAAESWAYPVAPCDPHDTSIFPTPESPPESLVDQYSRLAETMLKEFAHLRNCPPHLLVDSLMSLCRLYMAHVPSTTRDEPDVSLYDHATTTAAFACALLAYHQQTETLDESAIKDRQSRKFLLVSGDLSGIQNFLLDLPREKAPGLAKVLRARSFYLTMITRAANRMLLENTGLPSCNCVLDAGGRFILLLPNTVATKQELVRTRRQISTWLLRQHNGRISLNLSEPLELAGLDFSSAAFSDAQEMLSRKTDLGKKNRFRECLQAQDKWEVGSQVGRFQMDDERINDFVKLGQKLPRMKFITLGQSGGAGGRESFLGFFDAIDLEIHESAPSLAANTLEALAVNCREFHPGFAGYNLANHVPVMQAPEIDHYSYLDLGTDEDGTEIRPGQIKTFEHLAAASVEVSPDGSRRGQPLLGVFKADVDRLGMLFSEGLGAHHSIGRLAALSRQVDLFFRGYLHNLLEGDFPEIYTEYAGGDDVLLIGPWTSVIRFARILQQLFTRYTCHNPDINISAAIVLAHPRHPIAQSIRQAETLLEGAKNSGRNRIAALGVVLSWDDFAEAVDNGVFLDELLRRGQENGRRALPRGFVYRLLQYHRRYRQAREGDMRAMLWRSHLAYDIQRNVKEKVAAAERERIEMMTQLSESGREMEMLGASATYALYKNRKSTL